MEMASRESAEYHQSLDPFSSAAFAVSWAGEEVSMNWFDTTRAFTERWRHQRDVPAEPGTILRFEISGDCGGVWRLYRDSNAWRLVDRDLGEATSTVTIPQEIAWRIFTRGIDRVSGAAQTRVEGNPELGLHILSMKAIVG
jgi:hypothetical protein